MSLHPSEMRPDLRLITTPPDIYRPHDDAPVGEAMLRSMPNPPLSREFGENDRIISRSEISLLHDGVQSLVRYYYGGLERPTILQKVRINEGIPHSLRGLGLRASGSITHGASAAFIRLSIEAESQVTTGHIRETDFIFRLPGCTTSVTDESSPLARRYIWSRRISPSHLSITPETKAQPSPHQVTVLQALTAFQLLQAGVKMPASHCPEIPLLSWADIARGLKEIGHQPNPARGS